LTLGSELRPRAARRPGAGWAPRLRGARRTAFPLALVAPAAVFLLALLLYPLISVVQLSFQESNLLHLETNRWVGLENYVNQVSTDLFWVALRNTLVWTFGSVIGEYGLGLTSALVLNERLRFRPALRGVVVIPWIVPIVIASMTWRWILNPQYGIANVALVQLGLLKAPFYWLGQPETALYTTVFVNVWRSFPLYTLALLAGLQAIPREESEAASIDGAGRLQRWWYVTMPHLRSVTLVIVVLHIIWTFNNFDFVWLLTEGGPLHASELLSILVYKSAFKFYELGSAAALSVIMIAILSAMIAVYLRLLRAFESD